MLLAANSHWEAAFAASRSLMTPTQVGVGLEVELDRFRISRSNLPNKLYVNGPRWMPTHDGSLENGVELTTHGPSGPPTVSEGQHMLWELSQCIPSYQSSWRASTQVHVDVGSHSYGSLLLTCYNYIANELSTFAEAGAGRHESNFCVPWWTCHELVLKLTDALLEAVHTGLSEKLVAVINNWPKYSALNLLPISYQGTVEWRHLQTPSGADFFYTTSKYFHRALVTMGVLDNMRRPGLLQSRENQAADKRHRKRMLDQYILLHSEALSDRFCPVLPKEATEASLDLLHALRVQSETINY